MHQLLNMLEHYQSLCYKQTQFAFAYDCHFVCLADNLHASWHEMTSMPTIIGSICKTARSAPFAQLSEQYQSLHHRQALFSAAILNLSGEIESMTKLNKMNTVSA